MILAIDVAYTETSAQIAGIVFEHWNSQVFTTQYVIQIDEIADYESGQFYKRELPCIFALFNQVKEQISTIVVDGFVYLGEEQKAGLGKHLYDALTHKIPVIGVAKNPFKGTPKANELLRGESTKPLYVTAIDIDLDQAKLAISEMHGKHRIPTLLKLVDQLSRVKSLNNGA
ncbi:MULTISPECIES: endonuclease V [unclassified Acinetobacter]|uniref:endonuclease V n=1 Tax=unclassified Acinetobacter TaxID=196816 RepID=UPI00157B63D2|nr:MULTISPECIES: endonuclease V [unclassified Acinetobacter]MDM1757568.1 endonuclease V [Acinetobacter sp. 256-1]MDM1761262.1 endonuclease V [Acinetobacter sp. 251-1]